MRKLIWPVLFLLLLLVQGSLSVYFTGWFSCDLVLLALYAYAMLRGEKAGALAGGFIGFFQDALTVGVFGYHVLSRICFGYLIGLTKEKVFRDNFIYHMSAIATCSFILRFVYWWLELVRNGFRWSIFGSYALESLGYIVGNVLLVWPMVLIVKKIYEWIKSEDISY